MYFQIKMGPKVDSYKVYSILIIYFSYPFYIIKSTAPSSLKYKKRFFFRFIE